MRMMKETKVKTVAEERRGSIQNSPTCTRNMETNVQRRVMASEVQAQKILPTALPMLAMPTMPAAATALTLAISWNIGDSCEMCETPAETLRWKGQSPSADR